MGVPYDEIQSMHTVDEILDGGETAPSVFFKVSLLEEERARIQKEHEGEVFYRDAYPVTFESLIPDPVSRVRALRFGHANEFLP